jgi:hypothetical protein
MGQQTRYFSRTSALSQFRTTVPTPNLVLTCNINNLEHLFLLAAEISGTKLTAPQLNSVCAQPAKSGADPATRFNNADIPTLAAVDAGYYHTGEIELYSILFGHSGPLYTNTRKCPPEGAIIVMKLLGTVPNKPDPVYDHAIFIPDRRLLITMNSHIDTKDKGKRIRNAWHIRHKFVTDINNRDSTSGKRSVCDKRIAGTIFGGGDGSHAEVLRAAIIYPKPSNLKVAH